ncbi:MAG: hypothetical protein QXH27_00300 [Candidatus Micrarchaeia archaeon]
MKRLALVAAIAMLLLGCPLLPPPPAPNVTQNATPPIIPPAPPANITPATRTVLVPYEVNETYVEEVELMARVLAGPQNVEVKNLSIVRSQNVSDSEEECAASLVLSNPNPFHVYFNAEYDGVMDSAPQHNLHFRVSNVVTEMYALSGREVVLPSGIFKPEQYVGPYSCYIDLGNVRITILPHDGVHYAELPRKANVTKTRSVTLYRNETVPA